MSAESLSGNTVYRDNTLRTGNAVHANAAYSVEADETPIKNMFVAETEYSDTSSVHSYVEIYGHLSQTGSKSKLSNNVSMQEDVKKGSDADKDLNTTLAEEFYPIFLPIDQKDFRAIYGFARKFHRKKSLQDRTYIFLEHPVGWICFFYHFGV